MFLNFPAAPRFFTLRQTAINDFQNNITRKRFAAAAQKTDTNLARKHTPARNKDVRAPNKDVPASNQ